MPRFEYLREPLGQILREDTNCYWLCYQILNRLRERHPDILESLENQYPGQGYGQGGGAHYRPDNAIAQCLTDWRECVDLKYLRGDDLQIGNIRATDEGMGIYRWISS